MNIRIYSLIILSILFSLPVNIAWAEPADRSDGGKALYVVDPSWPQKPAEFDWKAMPGVAVDENDLVYLFTRSEPAVQIFRPDGSFVRAWHPKNYKLSHHIEIGPEGNIWLADFGTHVVEKYTPDGKLLMTLGTPGETGCDGTHFNRPTDMAILPSGDIFVSDGYANRRIAHFDKQGRFVKQWGEDGTEPGQFALPHAIAADSKGRLYVADRNNCVVQVFDQSGKLLDFWDDIITPWGIWITKADEIWICGSTLKQRDKEGWKILPPSDQVLMKFNPAGKLLLEIPLPMDQESLSDPGQLNWVHAIAIDSKGNLYMGDIMGKRAQKFVPRKPKR
jgi:NHL repeat